MAHQVTERDGLFTVRKPAWHGLGVVLPDYPTREQAQAIAHPWEPVTEPLYRQVAHVEQAYLHPGVSWCSASCPGPAHLETRSSLEFEEVPERAIVRSDTGDYLGATSPTRGVVTNSELYDIAEALEDGAKGSVMFETGGSLFGGQKVWLLLRLRDPIQVAGRPGTEVIPYYALQNGHTATAGAFRGQATMTAIVCDNTSRMADLDAQARGTEFVFRHTSKISERIEEAKTALAGWRTSVETFNRMSEHLVSLRVDKLQTKWFVDDFIPMPPPHTVSPRVVANVEKARAQVMTILGGVTIEPVAGTAYGLVQGAVEYLNHHRKANNAEGRFKRAYLDKSVLTADAVKIALEVSKS